MMPFYFLISGYNYKPGVLSYGASVRKRARQLLVPLVNYTIAIWIILGAYLCRSAGGLGRAGCQPDAGRPGRRPDLVHQMPDGVVSDLCGRGPC